MAQNIWTPFKPHRVNQNRVVSQKEIKSSFMNSGKIHREGILQNDVQAPPPSRSSAQPSLWSRLLWELLLSQNSSLRLLTMLDSQLDECAVSPEPPGKASSSLPWGDISFLAGFPLRALSRKPSFLCSQSPSSISKWPWQVQSLPGFQSLLLLP